MMQTQLQFFVSFISLIHFFTSATATTAALHLQQSNIMKEFADQSTECRFNRPNRVLPPAIRAYIASTVVRGQVIEKIHTNSSETLILMHIYGVYKLNGHTMNETSFIRPLSIPNDVKLQTSDRFNSYILVRNSPGCNGMQLRKSYFLFLESNIQMERVIHPIKVIRSRRRESLPSLNSQQQKLVVLVRVPLFSMHNKPVEVSRITSDIIERTLCHDCARPVSVSIARKFHVVYVSQKAQIFCQFNGNPPPQIFWQKYGERRKILTDDKYTVTTLRNFSVLIIKSATEEDSGVYFCGARDYVSRGGKLTVSSTDLQVESFDHLKAFHKKQASQSANKRTRVNKIKMAKSKENSDKTKSSSTQVIQRIPAYVPCSRMEDMCLNGGLCMKSNPELEIIYAKKFCRCNSGFEGPNCEIKIVTSILNFSPKDIPTELSALWRLLSNKKLKSPKPETA